MQQLLTQLIDLIFPPTPESITLRNHHSTNLLQHYSPHIAHGVYYLSHYDTPLIQAAIRANKFQHHRKAGTLLATLLTQWVTEQTEPLVFIPIPLGTARARSRGHNQITTVLNNLASKPHTVNALKRTKETAPQTHLHKADRLTNVQNAFAVTTKIKCIPAGAHVVLLDDVLSTGATMQAARASLAPHLPPNCTLTCLALAH